MQYEAPSCGLNEVQHFIDTARHRINAVCQKHNTNTNKKTYKKITSALNIDVYYTIKLLSTSKLSNVSVGINQSYIESNLNLFKSRAFYNCFNFPVLLHQWGHDLFYIRLTIIVEVQLASYHNDGHFNLQK